MSMSRSGCTKKQTHSTTIIIKEWNEYNKEGDLDERDYEPFCIAEEIYQDRA